MIPVSPTVSSPRIFHLLTESEPFSDHHGGAISRWVANVIRHDSASLVLAPSADRTWGIPSNRVRLAPGLVRYKRINDVAGRLLRWPVRARLLRYLLIPALAGLRPNDTLWIHNRPEFAAALSPWTHRRGVRLVLHLHNSHLLDWSENTVRSIQADRYIFVSRFLQQQAAARFRGIGHTEVLYNGASDSIFFPRERSSYSTHPPVALFAGRLVPEKGLHIFVEAMRLLRDRGVCLNAVVLGGAGFGQTESTPYIQHLKRSAPTNLTFLPYASGAEIGERFRAADIFCMPSCWDEPLGMVVLEAMASGLPIVATHSGGIPEMLAEGGGGLLVARNSAIELAEALERLATDLYLRHRLSQQALISFRKSFTWDVVRQNYRRIVDSLQFTQLSTTTDENPTHLLHQEELCRKLPISA